VDVEEVVSVVVDVGCEDGDGDELTELQVLFS
jgi:hypothetical protein